MELTIEKRDFLRGLTRTHAVADRKNPMQILSNVVLSTESTTKLRLAATDLYLGVTATAPAKVTKGGSIALSARTLFDIVKALPDGEIKLSVDGDLQTTIEQGRIRYKIPGLPDDEFPPIPNPGDSAMFALDAELLGELISVTSYSMSSDDTRPHLAGAMFQGEAKLVRMVTTDGYRLSKAEQRLDDHSPMLDFSMLVPHKGVGELKKIVDDARTDAKGSDSSAVVEVATGGGNAFFRSGEQLLSVKIADEQFPPYDKVIPSQQSKRVVASRVRLIDALRRISLVANDKSGRVQLHLEPGLLRIQSQNPDVGEGVDEVEVDYAGEPLSIGFNARYFLDALSALPHDEVALELGGALEPCVIRPVGDGVDFVGVIMPMRI